MSVVRLTAFQLLDWLRHELQFSRAKPNIELSLSRKDSKKQ